MISGDFRWFQTISGDLNFYNIVLRLCYRLDGALALSSRQHIILPSLHTSSSGMMNFDKETTTMF